MYRCLNNMWGYCDTKPQPKGVEEKVFILDFGGRQTDKYFTYTHCRLDPLFCGHYRTFSETVNTLVAHHAPLDAK